MKIIILNINGGSIYHGPNLRTYYAAKALTKRGYQVTIVSSSYSHKYSVLPEVSGVITEQIIDGITYKWIRCREYSNLLQRIISIYEYGIKVLLNRKKIATKADFILFSGPPTETFYTSWILSKIFKAPLVSDVRDLWPLTQIQMNKLFLLNPYTYFLYLSQYLMLRGSKCLVSPLPGAGEYYSKISKKARTVVIENGFDFDREVPLEEVKLKVLAAGQNLRFEKGQMVSLAKLKAENTTVVGYSGAFDRDNDIDSLVKAAYELSDRSDVEFFMVGDGLRRDWLLQAAESSTNIVVFDRVQSSIVPSVLSVMDICYCGLRQKSIYQYGVSPAKCSEYMAAKKPLIWMVDAYNNPVRDSGGGFSVEPENIEALVQVIREFISLEEADRRELGEKAYNYLNENFSYDVLGEQWSELIEKETA